MQQHAFIRWMLTLALLLGGTTLPSQAQTQELTRSPTPNNPRQLAAFAEQRRDWSQATALYESLLRKDRDNVELRAALLRCLRRGHIARRHRDPSYEGAINQLAPSQALDIYQQVLLIIPSVYVDQYRTSIPELVASGIQEFLLALEEEAFLRQYLPGPVPADLLKEFKKRLTRLRDRRPGSPTREQARDLVLNIGQLAHDLHIPVHRNFLVALALEMTAGACNALDEYTFFLTPGAVANEALGLAVPVGIGLELTSVEGQFFVGRVYPRGPAEEAGMVTQTRVLRLNGQMIDGLNLTNIMERLRGEAGSLVELEILPPGQMMPQTVRLERRPVSIPTVEHRLLLDPMDPEAGEMIGYLRITGFHSSTVQDVKEALAQLQTRGARGIVLDLRGNGGGLFEAAVKVSELFLPEGQVVVRAESPLRQFNRPFPVESTNPLTLPLVVLIDGETASAAEVLVGALKDSNRARLMGQPTFGKGLVQCVIPVTRPGTAARLATALKITVARFSSPSRTPISPQGILPHDVLEVDGELAISAARVYLSNVLRTLTIR